MSQQERTGDEGYPFKMATGIPGNFGQDHIGIVVPDAQKAADFLRIVFDARFDWDIRREPHPTAGERGWSEKFGVPENAFLAHVIMLQCGDLPLAQFIELFEWRYVDGDTVLPREEREWLRFDAPFNSYFSFSVADMDATLAYIRSFVLPNFPGTRLIQDPPMDFPLRGEVCTSTFLVAPWGQWIELTSWSKSREKGTLIAPCQNKEDINEDKKLPFIGDPVDTLPMPALLLDLDALEQNAALMAARCRARNIAWRVPCKAHKSPAIARRLFGAGAQGVVLLTVDEAEHFADAGVDDIYLANMVSTHDELRRLSLLAKRVRVMRVPVDSIAYADCLAAAMSQWEITVPIQVLIEMDVGHHRCGVSTVEEVVALAAHITSIRQRSGSLILVGITGYEGHTPVLPPNEKAAETKRCHSLLAEAADAIDRAGYLDRATMVITGAGSCNYMDALAAHVLTEVQAGGGALCDVLYAEKAGLADHGHIPGMRLAARVVSVAADGSRGVANAGFKAAGWHPFGGLPVARCADGVGKPYAVAGLSAEHTKLRPAEGEDRLDLAWGDVLVMDLAYTDAAAFLHARIFGVRGKKVVEVFDVQR